VGFVFSFLGSVYLLSNLFGEFKDCHSVGVLHRDWNEVLATVHIHKYCETNFLAVLKGTPSKATNVPAHLVSTPGSGEGEDVCQRNVDVLLLLIQLLLIGHGIVHDMVVDDDRGRVGRLAPG